MGIRTRCDPAIELIEQVPGLPKALIEQATGQELPEHDEVRVEEVWEYTFYTRGVDSLLLFRKEEEPRLAVILRMVHDRLDDHKSNFWPHLVSWVRATYGCPTIFVALSESPELAAWAREPVNWVIGSMTMWPVAVYLGEIEPGDNLGLSLLFGLSERATAEDLKHSADGLAALPFEQAERIAGVVDVGIQGDAAAWRSITESAGYSLDDWDLRWMRRKVYEAAKLRGMARSLLRVAKARGFELSERVRTRILTTEDRRRIEHWLDRAAVTDDVERLFSLYRQGTHGIHPMEELAVIACSRSRGAGS